MPLIDSLATTEKLAALFSDRSVLGAMLEFEAALRPELTLPAAEAFDAEAIAREARRSATLAIPFVEALRAAVPEAHRGATSQDLVDTTIVLLVGRAVEILRPEHVRLRDRLRELSEEHAGAITMARTLLQPAEPTTFGYRVACWYGPIDRSWSRLYLACGEAMQLQFGGPAGTLAHFGDRGREVAQGVADRLRLKAGAPWHTQRDRMATLMAQFGVYAGSLAKVARDIALLMQPEIGELAEPGGGSSSMAHKRNPSNCVTAMAAAARVPPLVGAYLAAMPQELERAAGGWQSEWPTIAGIVQATGATLEAVATAVCGLTVNVERMRANVTVPEPEKHLGCAEEFRRMILEDYVR